MAKVYQPKAPGPFPAVLDLHGGAWNNKDRSAEVPMDRALASSGLLVVAVDMTVAPEAPYPACVQDANWSVRWLKVNAARWNGDASRVGIYGSSSGGHVAELLAMRPNDPRYNAIPLADAAGVDATIVLGGDTLADQRPVRPLRERQAPQPREHDQQPPPLLQAVGGHPRGQPAGDPRAQGEGQRWCRC